MTTSVTRRDELAGRLKGVEARIRAAEIAADRGPGSVRLIVVTKFFPASDVLLLAGLGVREVAENRHQEASLKVAEVGQSDLTWHFIGQLQTNKATAVARYADQVDSVDRPSLIVALNKGALAADREVGCLIQVNLDPNPLPGRGGAVPGDVPGLAETIRGSDRLRLLGVMGVAPPAEDPRPAFEVLAQASARLREIEPTAVQISAGMSGDLEEAVAAGATHVRVGTAILGSRP